MLNANTLHLQKRIPPTLCDNGFYRSELVERPTGWKLVRFTLGNNVNWELALEKRTLLRVTEGTCHCHSTN